MISSNIMTINEFSKLKPVQAMHSIIKALTPCAKEMTLTRNREVFLDRDGKRWCLALLEGNMNVYRLSDNILVGTIRAPYILGVSQLESINALVKCFTVTPVTILLIPYDDAIALVEKNNLWKELSVYISYMFGMYIARDYKLVGAEINEVLVSLLREMMNETEALRLRTNICQYIMEKTDYSRSHVMKHLSALRKKELIVIQRGILISIDGLVSIHSGEYQQG